MFSIGDDEFMYAYLQDPETCDLQTLKNQVHDLEALVGFFDTKQLALKKFINSIYGALGSKYFIAHNTAIAESITAQGRDLNHYSENSVNEYFRGIFQSDPDITLYYQWVHHDENGKKFTFGSEDKPDDYYKFGKWVECRDYEPAVSKGKKLTPDMKYCLQDNSEGHCDWFMTKTKLSKKLQCSPEEMKTFDISKGKTTETGLLDGPEFDYLEGNQSMTIGGDTDSVNSLSIIKLDGSVKVKIEDAFKQFKEENNDTVLNIDNGSEIVPVHNHTTQTYDEQRDMISWRPINYIMRHKVKKSKFKITTESGKSIIVTGDHSCMVIRDNVLMPIKAKDINIETDKIITVE